MAGMSKKEIARLVDHVAEQGVTATRTKAGILLRLPDNKTTMVHFTTSDVRARENLRAVLRRSGITMPTDKHSANAELPPYITSVKPTRASLRRAQESLDRLGLRKVSTKQLVNAEGAPNVIQAAQVLYALGWLPDRTGKNVRRYWLAPVETDLEPYEEEADELEAEPAPLRILPPPAEAPETASGVDTASPVAAPEAPPAGTTPPPREFLDTADSWAGWDALPDELTLGQVKAMLAGLGMDAELRVWRR